MNMQIDRLLEIVLILLNREHITAKELAERFHVSTRTIYRDIDTLSLAGIPIYSLKGNGGGIGLLKNYTIDKSLLSEKEQKDIIFALQSINALKFPDVDGVLNKISALFKNVSNTNWIEVDFAYWGSHLKEKTKFTYLKEAILTKTVISFEYVSSYGEKTNRNIEPLRLVFKGHSWYVQGYCRNKQDFRTFRISRMKNIQLCNETFTREIPNDLQIESHNSKQNQMVSLKLKFASEIAYRVYDDFEEDQIEYGDDNTFIVTIDYPFDEWVIGYILSFGSFVEVLEPDFVKDIIKKRARNIIEIYK
ncbi:deoR-like helix-turn-helix domain protein [Clostridium argentinense CDC 2741]|uniref:DeoR-like helix-turn-helix domain protein n=2 Tax=Clostridium argentinense TaxID=29341 RepID=A0A0C1UFA5_9CLOT|nr:deoR-like helix-turn-helix domain protein [Clostridium argentinense CDC 2741]